MSGQELVDKLRAFIPGVSDMGTLSRAADRIEAQAARIEALEAERNSYAAVIAEALAALETTGIHEAYNILSTVPADVLSAYTTRVREESVAVEREHAARIAEQAHAYRGTVEQWAGREIAARIRSEIPEGQNSDD